jgi:hypothetical protein
MQNVAIWRDSEKSIRYFWLPAASLILLEFSYAKTDEAKHLNLYTGIHFAFKPNCKASWYNFCHLLL